MNEQPITTNDMIEQPEGITPGETGISAAYQQVVTEEPVTPAATLTTEPPVAPTQEEPATQKSYETYDGGFNTELSTADNFNPPADQDSNEFTFETTASNVTRTRPTQKVQNANFDVNNEDIVGIPNLTEKEQLEFYNLPVWEQFKNSEEADKLIDPNYLAALANESDVSPSGNNFENSLKHPQSHWMQTVPHQNFNIGAAKPSGESYNQGERLTGLKALAKALSTYNIGSPIVIPLWHSGLWLGFKAVSEEAYVSLIETIENEKITQGRNSGGAVFSNTKVYYYKHFIDFAINHVISSNLENMTPEKLRKLIKINDIPVIAWALGCTMYPKGIKYRQACRFNPEKCQHVYDITLSLAAINWVNVNALSESQRDHMLNRNHKYKVEEIEQYQKNFTQADIMGKTFTSDDGRVSLYVSTPSVQESIDAGETWLNEIAAAVRDVISDGETDEERIEYRMGLSIIRNYTHYIKSIRFTEDDTYVDEPHAINEVITALAGHKEVGVKILQDIKDYIDESSINLIAIPRVNCRTVIDGEQHKVDEEGSNPYLVVVDALSLFFQLGVQKLRQKLSLRA